MAGEGKKDFNAMLHDSKDMPKIITITDEKSIARYGGSRMYLAPPLAYDRLMRQVPKGKLVTVGQLRELLARQAGADFTDPITAGIFVSLAAWASAQRAGDETPYWRTLKAEGELNPKYPGGVEAEGHTVLRRGRTNFRYFVEDLAGALLDLQLLPFQIGVAKSRFVKPCVKISKVGSRLLMDGCPINWKFSTEVI